jgi:phosphatidylserine/phosphatidylglycerophosphate/cardiolipin synthase-like enzyme
MIRWLIRRWLFWLMLMCIGLAPLAPLRYHALAQSALNPNAKQSSARTEAAFARNGDAADLVVKAIESAQHSIRVAAYSFTNAQIAKALIAAHRRGMEIRVVLDSRQARDQYGSATFLANAGIATRTNRRYAILHHKFMVIDDRHVQTGSFNYTSSAAKRNAENVLIVWDNESVAKQYAQEWRQLWEEGDDYSASNE